MSRQASCCVIVPGYQEAGRIGQVVAGVRQFWPHVLVVDDGSADRTADEAREAGAEVVRHPRNRGKGAALQTGFQRAREKGYEAVITMDADGQHAPSDVTAFLDSYARNGDPVIIGNRMGNPGSMPFVRRLTNRFMSWLLSRRIGQRVPDTQCGFRLYRLDVIPPPSGEATGFAAESEILLDLGARGVRIGSVPIQVIYGDERSKIHPVRDTARFFRMLRRHRRGVRQAARGSEGQGRVRAEDTGSHREGNRA